MIVALHDGKLIPWQAGDCVACGARFRIPRPDALWSDHPGPHALAYGVLRCPACGDELDEPAEVVHAVEFRDGTPDHASPYHAVFEC